MTSQVELTPAARMLLEDLRNFCLPGGEEAARHVNGLRITERGEMRSAPEAPWAPFTSEQTIDARRSGFCWEARIRSGRMRTLFVTDAYEEGRGRLVAKLGGFIPVANFHGPEFDKGEIQRYLASIVQCPPILLLHPSLEWTAVGPRSLRMRDLADPTGAAVDLDLGDDGRPLGCRADRPRLVGKRTILTPWSASCSDPMEWEGLRVPSRNEVAWHLPERSFVYYRGEITSLIVQR